MVEISSAGGRPPYNFYSIIALVFVLLYATACMLVLFTPQQYLDVTVRDLLSGMFLVGVVFGMPVVMLIGMVAIIHARVEHKRGILFGILALLAPIIFLLVLKFEWKPTEREFWRFQTRTISNSNMAQLP